MTYDRIYRWRLHNPAWYGRRCRVIARGTMNSAMIRLRIDLKHAKHKRIREDDGRERGHCWYDCIWSNCRIGGRQPMTTEEVLLAAIRATPGDDMPRLAFADRLDELPAEVTCPECGGKGWFYDDSGGNIGVEKHCLSCSSTGSVTSGNRERAEFIRVQCKLTAIRPGCRRPNIQEFLFADGHIEYSYGLPGCGGECEYCQLSLADFQILQRCKRGWLNEFPFGIREASEVTTFSRGFIHTVRSPLATWIAHGPAIVRSPVACVERVDVMDREPARFDDSCCYWGGYHPNRASEFAAFPHMFPKALLDHVRKTWQKDTSNIVWYHGEDRFADARTALSRACLEWAWAQATIPGSHAVE